MDEPVPKVAFAVPDIETAFAKGGGVRIANHGVNLDRLRQQALEISCAIRKRGGFRRRQMKLI